MATVASSTYRAPMFRPGDDLFQRCLLGSTVLGVLLLLVIFIPPIAQQAIQSVDTEPVMAHLVVPKPPPVVTPVPVAPPAPVGTVGPGEDLHAKPGPRGGEGGRGGHSGKPVANPHPAGGGPSPSAVAGGGEIGRARAAQVAASLSGSTAALSQALSGLSSSLKSTSGRGASSAVPPVVRVVSSGRSDVQLSSILSSVQGASSAGRTGSADVRGSAVQSSLVSIGSLS